MSHFKEIKFVHVDIETIPIFRNKCGDKARSMYQSNCEHLQRMLFWAANVDECANNPYFKTVMSMYGIKYRNDEFSSLQKDAMTDDIAANVKSIFSFEGPATIIVASMQFDNFFKQTKSKGYLRSCKGKKDIIDSLL